MMIDHKLVHDWSTASPGDHLCSVYAWYTGNFPFGIRLVYAVVLYGIRVDFFTYSLVYGLSLVRYTRGIRWYTGSCLSGIRKVYAGIRWSPVTCVGLTWQTDNIQTLLLTSPDMWKRQTRLAEDPLQFKCSGWPAPKRNATNINHFLAEDPLQSYKQLTGSNKWGKKQPNRSYDSYFFRKKRSYKKEV